MLASLCLATVQRVPTRWNPTRQAAIFALILLASCQREDADREPLNRHPTISVERLRAIATKACKCKMAGRDASAVDRELTRLTAHLSKEELGTASFPLSYHVTCFPALGDDACMTNAIIATGSADDASVCTEAEADELEALWKAKPPSGAPQSTTLSDTAMIRRLRGMRASAAAALPQSACDQI